MNIKELPYQDVSSSMNKQKAATILLESDNKAKVKAPLKPWVISTTTNSQSVTPKMQPKERTPVLQPTKEPESKIKDPTF